MARDFAAIKTREDAWDALVGAHVKDWEPGKGFLMESVAGEVFRLTMSAEPVKVAMGTQTVTLEPNTFFSFHNVEHKA